MYHDLIIKELILIFPFLFFSCYRLSPKSGSSNHYPFQTRGAKPQFSLFSRSKLWIHVSPKGLLKWRCLFLQKWRGSGLRKKCCSPTPHLRVLRFFFSFQPNKRTLEEKKNHIPQNALRATHGENEARQKGLGLVHHKRNQQDRPR